MIARIRKGNDFKHIWPITWNGQPEDFSDATDITLTAKVYGQVKTLTEGVDYHIDGGTVMIDFTPSICDITGTYTVELNYIKPSAEFIDGDRRSAVDVQAFQIVNTSAEANSTEGVSLPSEALAIYALKYEDLSPENIAELQRPATEAAASVSALEQTVSDNEALRVDAEQDRVDAELLRVGAESARSDAEGLRDSNEIDRIAAEGIRNTNETGRINAESDRMDAEDLRDQAEAAREEAEGLRQTNTTTAIQDAGEATTAANTAAGLAGEAATTANTAAGDANDAASAANSAAGLADTARTELTTAVNTKLGEADDKIEEMNTTLSTYDGRVTQVEADIDQLAGDIGDKITISPDGTVKKDGVGVNPITSPFSVLNRNTGLSLQSFYDEAGARDVLVFDDDVTATSATAISFLGVKKGKTYNIISSSNGVMPVGLRYYFSSPDLPSTELVVQFNDKANYADGVSHEFTPEVDGVLKYWTGLVGVSFHIKVSSFFIDIKDDIENIQLNLNRLDNAIYKAIDLRDGIDVIANDTYIANSTVTIELVSLKKGNTYRITASSEDNLSNGLRFYFYSPSGGLIKEYPPSTIFTIPQIFEFTPDEDNVLRYWTQKVGVSVNILVEHIYEPYSKAIEGINDDLKPLKRIANIDGRYIINGEFKSDRSTAIDVVRLDEGVTYDIIIKSDDSLTNGFRLYFGGDGDISSYVIKDFASSSDFSNGVTFNFTPPKSGVLKYWVGATGMFLNLKIKNIREGINDIVKTDFVDKRVSIKDYTTIYTTTFEPHNIPEGEYLVYVKAQYEGQFTIYNTDSSSPIYNNNNHDYSSGLWFRINLVGDNLVRFRTFKVGVFINEISLYGRRIPTQYNAPKSHWEGRSLATYGDSITEINNGTHSYPYRIHDGLFFGDGTSWGNFVADYFKFKNQYGRGIGSQSFQWDDGGGTSTWVDTDGNYLGRVYSQSYDAWDGVTLPTGVTQEMVDNGEAIRIRGAGCSWLRITKMFPEHIKNDVDVVTVMFYNGSNSPDDKMNADMIFTEGENLDVEWASSEYYSRYGGDFNMTSVRGGIASTIMKLQTWMPNAIIVLMTPISGSNPAGADVFPQMPTSSRLLTFCERIREMSKVLSIPLIDVYAECGINGFNRDKYMEANGSVHPYPVEGSKMLARAVIGGLQGIMPNLWKNV